MTFYISQGLVTQVTRNIKFYTIFKTYISINNYDFLCQLFSANNNSSPVGTENVMI